MQLRRGSTMIFEIFATQDAREDFLWALLNVPLLEIRTKRHISAFSNTEIFHGPYFHIISIAIQTVKGINI